MSEQQVQVQCPACDGTGRAGYVTRDMAIDAGQPTREGESVTCGKCGGMGCIVDVEETPDPAPATERPAASDLEIVCEAAINPHGSRHSTAAVEAAIARLRAAPPDPFAEARATLERERPEGWRVEVERRCALDDDDGSKMVDDEYWLHVYRWSDLIGLERQVSAADLPRAVAEAVAVMREHKEKQRG